MTILNRLYASSGEEVEIDTVELRVNNRAYWLTSGYEDITAILESGREVTFLASEIEVSKPARNADGTQDLKIAISNIDGAVSTEIRSALASFAGGQITYRNFISTDLSSPADVPYTLEIKSGYWTGSVAQITAGYMNVLDTSWPRHRYNLSDHPGIRYIS